MLRRASPDLRVVVLLLVVVLAGCSAATSPVAIQTTTAPTPTPTAAPTPTPTHSPAAQVCVISLPTQWLTEVEPVVIAYRGVSDAQCDGVLKVMPGASAWIKGAPADPPEGRAHGQTGLHEDREGQHIHRLGTSAARYACASLK